VTHNRLSPVPIPTLMPKQAVNDWAEKLVPVLEKVSQQSRDSDGDLNHRVETLERGVSDVRVQRIFVSQEIPRSTFSTHYLVFTDKATVNVTLPPFEAVPGKTFLLKKMSAANSLVIKVGSGLVEGAASLTLTVQYESRTLISDGVQGWWIV
jgi:hypothetical protein